MGANVLRAREKGPVVGRTGPRVAKGRILPSRGLSVAHTLEA